MTDPFKPDDYTLAEEIFRQATLDNEHDEDNVSAIKTAFYSESSKAFKDGKFVTTVERLISDHLWQRMNNRAAGATRRVLRELESGQLSIPVDSWMDQVVTVGENRRSTVGNLGQSDILRMVQARKDNLAKADKNLQHALKVAKMLEPIWGQASTLLAAYKKNLLTLVQSVDDEADGTDEAAS